MPAINLIPNIMKNLFFGLMFLGIASLSYSQIAEVQLEDVNLTPLNTSYLNEVSDKSTPKIVRRFESEVARYDITEAPFYDDKFEAYEVIFEGKNSDQCRIVATYDNEGKVLSSLERFKDVALPYAVRNSIEKKYPGWIVIKDTYLVSYYLDKEVKKMYKLKIAKGNKRKNIKVDVLGNTI
ncbi:hypothetical protein DFR65_102176 [Oceanihabitans sediminis]|uniref:Nicotinate-nucleotide adenylyltransferase n=2 Tax=Oceanihabitans sediminis TaxID=1812012 RepID=A0A368P5R6_9FLAO|nr:hypothetical protein DFR65_102176 [Oceanihabitans sediminis]RCU57630.1 hypothetical protein DU428_07500 [Oceanihabitans sediminis]